MVRAVEPSAKVLGDSRIAWIGEGTAISFTEQAGKLFLRVLPSTANRYVTSYALAVLAAHVELDAPRTSAASGDVASHGRPRFFLGARRFPHCAGHASEI